MRGSLGCRSQARLPRLDQQLEMPYRIAQVWLECMPCPSTMPLCPLKEVYCSVLVSVRARLLVHYLELRGVRYSGVRFILVI